MRILTRLHLLSLGIVLAMTVCVIAAGTVIIHNILYPMEQRVLELELATVREELLVALNQSGVRAAAARAAQLREQLRRRPGMHSINLFVVEVATSRIIYHPLRPYGYLTTRGFVREMLARKSGIIEYDYDDGPRYAAFSTLRPINWLVGISITKAEILEKRDDFLRAMVAITFLVLCLNGIVISLFARRLVARLDNTMACVRRIEDGELGARISSILLQDEIGQLQRGINAMAAELQLRYQRQQAAEAALRESQALLEQRVKERTRELELANKELESFSYSVSHDLRAPLRAISGFAQILVRRHRSGLNEEGGHYLDNVLVAARHMEKLIEDMLHYSRTGRSPLVMRPVPLAPLLERVRTTFGERIAATGAHWQVDADLATPLADATLLEQVVANLVDNALTYRPPERAPDIAVSARREGNWVVLRVADKGIGIAPEFHEKIFQVFQRLHSQEDFPGTGIGLAIVAKAVRLMDGSVQVESALGAGSTFVVRLPAAGADSG